MAVKQHLRVFVASSTDVQPERARTPQVIEQTNRLLDSQGVFLDLWRWETHALPGLSRTGPQTLINPELDQADIVVLVVWNRIGPGTVEEYERTVQRWQTTGKPHLLGYFSQVPSVLDTIEAVDDRKKVIEVRNKLWSQGVTQTYDSVDDFARLVQQHLCTIAPQVR